MNALGIDGMDDFEHWFLIAYTAYFVAALAALLWVGNDDRQNGSRREFWQEDGDGQ
jgi:hypothetical protein